MEEPNNKPEISNKSQNPNSKKVNKWELAGLASEMGFIIALPLVVFAFAGKWLDHKVGNTTPWFTLLGIVLAISATTIWLTKKLKQYIK